MCPPTLTGDELIDINPGTPSAAQTTTGEVAGFLLQSVLNFGARANDSSWDSLPGFVAAETYIADNGLVSIVVPAGTYYFKSGAFSLNSNGLQLVCPNGVATLVQETWGLYGVGVFADRCIVRNIRSINTGAKSVLPVSLANRWRGEFLRTKCSGIVCTGQNNLFENVSDSGFVAGVRYIGGITRIWEASTYGQSEMTLTSLKLNPAQQLTEGTYTGFIFQARGTGGQSMTSPISVTSYDVETNTIGFDAISDIPLGTIYYLLLSGQSDGNVLRNHTTDNVDFGIVANFQDRIYMEGDLVATNIVRTQNAQPHHVYFAGSIDPTDAPEEETASVPSANEIYCSGSFRCTGPDVFMAYKFRNWQKFYGRSFYAESTRGCLRLEMGGSAVVDEVVVRNANSTDLANGPEGLAIGDVQYIEVNTVFMSVSPGFVGTAAAMRPRGVTLESQGKNRPPINVNLHSVWVEFDGESVGGAQYGVLVPARAGSLLANNGYLQVDRMTLIARNAVPITVARVFDTDRAVFGPMIRTMGADATITFESSCPNGLIDYDGSQIESGVISVVDNAIAATTSSNNAASNRATAGYANLVKNPTFAAWSGGTSFALAANTVTDIADDWKAWRQTASAAAASRQTGFLGSTYCTRIQRTAGNTSTQSMFLVQVIPSELVVQLAGGEITHLFAVRAGADYSGAELRTALFTGTGFNEAITATGFPTGGAVTANQNVALSTDGNVCRVRHFIPANATELAIRHEFRPSGGAAGAADYFELAWAAIIDGATAKPFSAFMIRG